MRSARSLWPEGVAAAAAVVAAWFVGGAALRGGFPVDDAWIHMVYGLALRDEGALAYNAGIPSTGATSPLWALVAMLAHVAAGARGPSMAAAGCLKGFSVLFHVLSSVLAALLARASVARRRHRAAAALAAGLLAATTPVLAFAAVSGMEVTLAGASMLAALLAGARGRTVLAGACAGCAALARPECVLVAPSAVVLGSMLGRRAGRGRRASWASVAAAAPVVAAVARNLAVSGRPLPATFYAKARVPTTWGVLASGAEACRALAPRGYVLIALLLATGLAAGVWACRRAARPRRAGSLGRVVSARLTMLATLVTGGAYVGAELLMIRMQIPDAFYYQRYLLPALPLLLTGAVAAAASLADVPRAGRAAPSRRRDRAAGGAAWAAVIVLFAQGVYGWRGARGRYAEDVRHIDEVQVAVGRALDAALAPDATVWVVDAGASRYWGRRRTVDLMKLNTPDLVRAGKVRKEWWADAIVVVPYIFHVSAAPGLLETMLVARAGDDPEPVSRSLGTQAVLRCAEGTSAYARLDTKVVISALGQLIAVGRCTRR